MNQKQLANVLIKILGLSLIAHGIPSLLDYAFGWLQFASDNRAPLFSDMVRNSHFYLMVILGLFPVTLGLAFLFGSRWLAEKLFKDEL
jgi:hypothetical protein